MPVTLLVDDCPLYDLEPAEPDGWIYGNGEPPARGRRRAPSRPTRCWRCSRSPTIASKRWAFEQYDSIVQSRTVRRPEQADAAVLQIPEAGTAIAVAIDGNGRRVGLRSLRRHGRGGARVRAEPRLRRRRAARPHQLPQLRQPREADGRLAARPLDAGARRRLRGARRARRRRQRLPLQRDRARARSTRPRSSAWSASCPIGRAAADGGARARATRSRSPGRSRRRWPARSWRSCAASSGPASVRSTIDAVRAAIAAVRDAVRAGAAPRRPRRQRRRSRLRARRVRDRRRRRAAGRPRPADRARGGPGERGCSARARAASCSPATGRARAARRGAGDAPVVGVAGGDDDRDRRRRGCGSRWRSPTPPRLGARSAHSWRRHRREPEGRRGGGLLAAVLAVLAIAAAGPMAASAAEVASGPLRAVTGSAALGPVLHRCSRATAFSVRVPVAEPVRRGRSGSATATSGAMRRRSSPGDAGEPGSRRDSTPTIRSGGKSTSS